MNHLNRSLGELIRGPILHTPQGMILLLASCGYWLYAACIALFDISTPFGWPAETAIFLFMVWPLILFLFFVKENSPSFLPSWKSAAWLVLYASLPFLFSIEF